jgi:hypothetical protein
MLRMTEGQVHGDGGFVAASRAETPPSSPFLIWPHLLIAELYEAADAARKRRNRAQVDNMPEEREAAERALDDAEAALTRYWQQSSTSFLYQLRIVRDENPLAYSTLFLDSLAIAAKETPDQLRDLLLDVLAGPIGDAIDDALSGGRR